MTPHRYIRESALPGINGVRTGFAMDCDEVDAQKDERDASNKSHNPHPNLGVPGRDENLTINKLAETLYNQ